jgi:hypothetical protein
VSPATRYCVTGTETDQALPAERVPTPAWAAMRLGDVTGSFFTVAWTGSSTACDRLWAEGAGSSRTAHAVSERPNKET